MSSPINNDIFKYFNLNPNEYDIDKIKLIPLYQELINTENFRINNHHLYEKL